MPTFAPLRYVISALTVGAVFSANVTSTVVSAEGLAITCETSFFTPSIVSPVTAVTLYWSSAVAVTV